MRSSNVHGSWLLECAEEYLCVRPWAGARGHPNVANLLGQLRFVSSCQAVLLAVRREVCLGLIGVWFLWVTNFVD